MKNPWNLLRPDHWVGSVVEIEAPTLQARGIRGLILDLDDTLVSAIDHTPTSDVHAWIERMKPSFAIYMLSNNPSARRVQQVADLLEIPCAHRAAKPRRRGFHQALGAMELRAHEVAIVGDQLFTDVLGGNRVGAYTILTTPLAPERKIWRRLMRLIEGMVQHEAAAVRDRLKPTDAKETP